MTRAVAILLLLALPAWADFQDGLDAYDRGDYATALTEWRPLAEQGDANAQYNLGVMYDDMYFNGAAREQDYAEAIRWYRLAAEAGDARAQSILGALYCYGDGGDVPQDYVAAHMWWSLAAAQGDDQARELRDNLVAEAMTSPQIEEAQRRAREWLEVHPQ